MDMEKIIQAFSGVQQVALSLRGDQLLMMVNGCSPDTTVPALEPGWKAVRAGRSTVIGAAAQVDLAIQRLSKDEPPPELARSAVRRQANGDLWPPQVAVPLVWMLSMRARREFQSRPR